MNYYPNGNGMNQPQQNNPYIAQGTQPGQQNPYQPAQNNTNSGMQRKIMPQSGANWQQNQPVQTSGAYRQQMPVQNGNVYQQQMGNPNNGGYQPQMPVQNANPCRPQMPNQNAAAYQQQPVNQSSMPYQQGMQNNGMMPPQQPMQNQIPRPQSGAQQQFRPQQPQQQMPPQNYNNSPFMVAQQDMMGYSRNVPPNQGQYQNYQQMMPQPAKPFNWNILIKVFVFAVVPLLFAAAMAFSQISILKWLFIIFAALAVLLLWVRPVVSPSNRLTITVVMALAVIVAIVSALMMPAADATTSGTNQRTGGVTPPSSQTSNYSSNTSGSAVANAVSQQNAVQVTNAPAQTEKDPLDTDAVRQLETFFYYWSVNSTDNMLPLCAPSWQSSQATPSNSLFQITANRTPTEYKVEKISGTENDFSRTVTLTATIDKNNHLSVSKYRMQVVMLLENGTWYVDPRSLTTQEIAETADPSITATPAPTATPSVSSSTKLYYNPDGGQKYHADPNCNSLNKKYKPLKGTFTYGELNKDKYKSLVACNICNAPLRQ